MSDFLETPKVLIWIANMIADNSGQMEGADFILNEKGARRFALSVFKEQPLMCWPSFDGPAMESVKWSSAAFILDFKDKDWIALSCQDIRIKNSQAMNPVRFRLFIPVTIGRLNAWIPVNPKNLSLGQTKINAGIPIFTGEPALEVPLKVLSQSRRR